MLTFALHIIDVGTGDDRRLALCVVPSQPIPMAQSNEIANAFGDMAKSLGNGCKAVLLPAGSTVCHASVMKPFDEASPKPSPECHDSGGG